MTKARSLSDFIESDGSVTLVDNQKIKIGTGNDLEIFHDGSNSYITESNATGNLFIKGTHIYLQNSSGQDALNLINGNVFLKSGGATKLQTTSTGVDVTGTVTSDGLTSSGNIFIDAPSGNPDLTIKTAGTGNNPSVNYRAGDNIVFDNMLVASASTDYWRVGYGASGSVTNEYLVVTSEGKTGLGVTNPAEKLHIDDTNSVILLNAKTSGSGVASVQFADQGTVKWSAGISKNSSQSGANFSIFEDGSSGSPKFTVKDGGNVGINESDPETPLHVSGTGGTKLLVENTDTNWAGFELRAKGNQANYVFFTDDTAERARIHVSDGNEMSFQTGSSPVQRLKLSGNDLVVGTGTVNETAKVISSGGTTILRAGDSNHSIVLRGTQDASGNITGNTNTMGFYEYGGYEFYTKQGNSRVKSLDMPAGGKVNIATSAPRSKYFDVNGVAEISESFYIANDVQYDFEYTVTSEGGAGNSFFIIAGYNHFYNTTYGAHRVAFMSARQTSMGTMINLGDQNTSSAGQWQFSKPTATTLRIRKTSGSYTGGGHGFIKVFFRDH